MRHTGFRRPPIYTHHGCLNRAHQMHHYIALRWNHSDTDAVAEATRLRAILERFPDAWTARRMASGLSIYSRVTIDGGMRVYDLSGECGVIIGQLFQASDCKNALKLTPAAARLMVETAGRYLLDNYWGSYVAILQDSRSDSTYIIRDCTGRIPCYHTVQHGVHIFFAALRDIECLGLRFAVNERYLAQSIHQHPLHLHATALMEVRQVLAGDCIAISPHGAARHSIWLPERIAMSGVIDDHAAALARLRHATESVIAAWSSVYDRVLIHLSGGLDSAIVLGCLKKLGLTSKVVCVNHYTPGTADDERDYARAAASLAGVSLLELARPYDGAAFQNSLDRVPFEAIPSIAHLGRMLLIGPINQLAEQTGCTTVWTGQGGDHIFLQAPHPHGATDYLLQHRLPRRWPRSVYDSAVLDRDSVWSVLWQSARYRLGLKPALSRSDDMRPDGTALLTPSALADVQRNDELPPDAADPSVPPGKQLQISDLRDLLNRHMPMVGLECPFEQHPLISQPLIELSLRVPTYLLQHHGRHRAMARDAFADRVPQCILAREDKGDITDANRLLLRTNAPRLCDLLLDGELVSRGLVQRRALEKVLLAEDTYRTVEIFPLFACIAAEKWLQNWAVSGFRASGNAVTRDLEGIC